jgi:hypothetical protein
LEEICKDHGDSHSPNCNQKMCERCVTRKQAHPGRQI